MLARTYDPLKPAPFASKKFLAFFVAEITWKILIASGLYIVKDQVEAGGTWMWWWMISATICVTFLEVGTILGLAYVDRFVDVARALGKGPGTPDAAAPAVTPASEVPQAPAEAPPTEG